MLWKDDSIVWQWLCRHVKCEHIDHSKLEGIHAHCELLPKHVRSWKRLHSAQEDRISGTLTAGLHDANCNVTLLCNWSWVADEAERLCDQTKELRIETLKSSRTNEQIPRRRGLTTVLPSSDTHTEHKHGTQCHHDPCEHAHPPASSRVCAEVVVVLGGWVCFGRQF